MEAFQNLSSECGGYEHLPSLERNRLDNIKVIFHTPEFVKHRWEVSFAGREPLNDLLNEGYALLVNTRGFLDFIPSYRVDALGLMNRESPGWLVVVVNYFISSGNRMS